MTDSKISHESGNNKRVLRGALIGCGFFAQNHLHAWQQLRDSGTGIELVALCDANEDRLKASAKEFGITSIYRNAEELFADEELDFVDIATTVASHKALIEMAAAAGVHCICQKPFAPNMDDAAAMVSACKDAGVMLMVHENFRWQTPIQAVRRVIDSGVIGTPFWGRVSFRSAFDVYSGQPYLATDDRFIIQDLGIHIIDIARFLFDEVETLSATTRRVNPRIAGEDVATMLMKHKGGITSVVDCSYATSLERELFPQTLIEIDATEGSLRLSADYTLTVHTRNGTTEHSSCKPPLHSWAQLPWFNIQDSVLNIQAHWIECLRLGQEPQTSGRDNLKTLELVEAAYLSAGQNQKAIQFNNN